jgi:hypothetical protein
LTLRSVATDGIPGTVVVNTEDSTLTYTPAANYSGTVSFGYTVVDAFGGTASGTVTVTVTSVNDAPVLSALPRVVFPEDSSFTLALDAFVEDMDNADAELTWAGVVQSPGPEDNRLTVQIDAATRIATLSGTPNFYGSEIPVRFTVSDPGGLSADTTIKVTVLPVNDAPDQFTRIAPQDDITIVPDSLQFVWSRAKDVENDQVIYTLKLIVGAERFIFTSVDTAMVIDMRALPLPQEITSISWTVEASDQQAVTGASNGIGTFDLDVATGVGDKLAGIPTEYFVEQNYPNPFNPSTTIRFGLPVNGHVTLQVFNLLGQRIASLMDEEKLAGNYEVRWQAGAVPSGLYFYRIQIRGATKDAKRALVATRKMYLVK